MRALDQLTAAGSIETTTQRMSDGDAKQLAGEILALFCEATRIARIPTGANDTVVLPRDIQ